MFFQVIKKQNKNMFSDSMTGLYLCGPKNYWQNRKTLLRQAASEQQCYGLKETFQRHSEFIFLKDPSIQIGGILYYEGQIAEVSISWIFDKARACNLTALTTTLEATSHENCSFCAFITSLSSHYPCLHGSIYANKDMEKVLLYVTSLLKC